MGKIARIVSSEIKDDKIICKCEIYPDYNVQAELYLPPGESSIPLPDDRTILVEIEGSGKYIACGLWQTAQTVEKGEKLLFSRNSDGDIMSKIYLDKDGKLTIETEDEINITGSKKVIVNANENIEITSDADIVLQSGTDFAVRYNELKSRLDDLKQDLNTLITTYNAHTHSGVQAGGSSTGSPSGTGTPSTVNFSNCKIDNINVPAVGE